jgi:hypothetical protein
MCLRTSIAVGCGWRVVERFRIVEWGRHRSVWIINTINKQKVGEQVVRFHFPINKHSESLISKRQLRTLVLCAIGRAVLLYRIIVFYSSSYKLQTRRDFAFCL